MIRKFLYFINPISGTKQKEPLLRLIMKRMQGSHLTYDIADTRADGNYAYLPQKIQQEQITDIIICGGDGTISGIAAHLAGTTVRVGIIPMGSGNGLALAAGISKDPNKAIDIILKNKPGLIDGFMINQHFSCVLCGLGFDAQVAHDFAGQSTRGLSTYVKQTIKNFFTSKTYPFVIEFEKQKIQCEALFISIANSNQFGNQVTIAPKASLNDGLLDIVVVNKMSKLATLFALLRQIKMGKVTQFSEHNIVFRGVMYLQSEKVTVYNPGKAPFHVDGDPVPTSEKFDVTIVPKVINLLQP